MKKCIKESCVGLRTVSIITHVTQEMVNINAITEDIARKLRHSIAQEVQRCQVQNGTLCPTPLTKEEVKFLLQ